MSLKSDLTIDASKFDRKLADKQTEEFNEKLIKIWADGPRWYEVSCRVICSPTPLTRLGRGGRVPQAAMGGQDAAAKACGLARGRQRRDTVA